MGPAVFIDLIASVVQIGVVIALVGMEWLSPATVFGALGIGSLAAVICWWSWQSERPRFAVAGMKADFGDNWSFGRWALGGQIVQVGSAYVMHWMVALLMSTEATGHFAACMALVMMANPILLGISNVLVPAAAHEHSRGSQGRVRRVVFLAFSLMLVICGAMLVAVLLFGPEILFLVYGAGFADEADTLVILSLATTISVFGLATHDGLWAINRPDANFTTSLLGIIAMVPIGFWLIPVWGDYGAAMSLLVGRLVTSIVRTVLFFRLVEGSAPPRPARTWTMNATTRMLHQRLLVVLTAVLLLGYLSLSRSFAHIGIGPLFIGEMVLAWFLLTQPRTVISLGVSSLSRSTPLTGFAWCLFASGVYGLVQCLRGILVSGYPMVAVQNFVFHVYPLFLFLGMWVGRRNPHFLRRTLFGIAWVTGVYGALYLTVFERYIPIGQNVFTWFGQPAGAAISLLGLLCFPRPLGRSLIPAMLNAFVLMGVQVRAEWLGFALALVLWGWLTRRLGRLVQFAIVGLLVLGLALIADVRIESHGTHAGEISVANIVGRALSSVNPELASQFTKGGESYGSTVSWRTGWWKAIWACVHSRPSWALFGPGYGFPIWNFHPEHLRTIIRTPHNVWVYALGYTGWLGVLLFAALQGSLGVLLWRTARTTGQPFGVCIWVMTLAWATFDNFFETPYGAIPYYLLLGLALAPYLYPSTQRQEI